MSDLLALGAAIVLPWLTGAACVAGCWRADAPGRWPAIMGYGYLLGMAGTGGLLLAIERVTDEWHYGAVVIGLGILLVLAAFVNRRGLWLSSLTRKDDAWHALGMQGRLLVFVLAVLIAWRLGGFLIEVLWRPVQGWDSWYFWSYRAKAFFSAGHWITPIGGVEWLKSSEIGYYGGFRHPPLISVIQLWPALALGRWDDSLTLLPWWLAGTALLAAVYGQLRVVRLPLPWALVAVFVLVSTPIVGTHYALGGYADIWIMAFTALAAMSLLNAIRAPEWRQWVLVACAALAIAFTKQTGILVSVVIIAAAVLAWLPARVSATGLLAVVLIVPVWALTVGIDFHVPMLGRLAIDGDQIRIPRSGVIELRPVWAAWFQRLLLDGTWHLLFWVAPVVLMAGLPLTWRRGEHRGLLVVVGGVFAMIATVYLFTSQASTLEDGTGVNRQLMQVAAPLIVWATMIVWDWRTEWRTATRRSRSRGAGAAQGVE